MEFNIVLQEDFKKIDDKIDRLIKFLIGDNRVSHNEKIYTNAELCKRLGISSKTLQSYRNNRLIVFNQIGRKIFYTEGQVLNFLESHQINTSKNKKGGLS